MAVLEIDPSEAIIGTWEAVKIEESAYGSKVTQQMNEDNNKLELTFNSDGTCKYVLGFEKGTCMYIVNGNKLSLIIEDITGEFEVTISSDEKSMTIERRRELSGIEYTKKIYFIKKKISD